MGSLSSRQNARNEETDIITNQMYKYPAKSGNSYFANYFIMGGEKFDAPQPEAYLFGDNMDLNFLGNRPIPFPYPPPQSNDPTRPLKCLINIRKESVRFVRVNDDDKTLYNVEFCFDTDVRCSIRIFYFSTEDVTSSGITYHSKDDKLTSDAYFYKRGSNQMFVQTEHVFDPSLYSDEELFYNIEKDIIPVAIQCVALEGVDDSRQSHTTIAVIEHHSDGSYSLKALKQKLFVDGLSYLLQEIYGIENKINETKDTIDDEIEDGGLECVICMSDMRDTLILPCRHLCLCQACADSLRYQANNCPICRSPFRALLQIKALQKYTGSSIATEHVDGVPIGYEHVSLIEALNGPAFTKRYNHPASAVEPLSDSSDIVPVIYSSLIRNSCHERLAKSLRVKATLAAKNNSCDEDETKDGGSPIPRGKLATHDTEDEDKSSSITDHLLYDKSSVICSPDTMRHINEISNTEDEMPDEDSDVDKLSPLLEVGISFENDAPSHIEISVTELNNERTVCKNAQPEDTQSSVIKQKSPLENTDTVDPVDLNSCDEVTDEHVHNLKSSTEDVSYNLSEELAKNSKVASSQPSTPASVASIRSSDDSYSSSGSSRRLLSSHEKPTLI